MIEVELPDGSIAEFPDGTEHGTIRGALQKRFSATQAAQPTQAQPAGLAQQPDMLTRASDALRGFRDIPQAGAQMLGHALPESWVSGINKAIGYTNKLPVIGPIQEAIGIYPQTPEEYDKEIAADEQAYQKRRQQAGETGLDGTRLAGNIAATAPATALAPLRAAGLGAAAGNAATQGAVAGALQPVFEGDFAQEKTKQIGLGGVAGGFGGAAGYGLGRVLSPKTSPDVRALMREGVTPTPGQVLGGNWSRAEEKLSSLPLIGDAIRSGQKRAVNEFDAAAINRALSPINEKLPKGVTGREAIQYAGDKLGQAYDDVLTKIGAVTPDGQFAQDLGSPNKLVQNLPDDQINQFGRIVKNEITDRIDANGVMTSEGMKAAESNLGKVARNYMKSGDYDQRQLGTAIIEVQSSLRQMLERVAPNHAPELRAINTGWANYMRPQRAAASVGAEDGVFTPAQLQNAVKALDPSRNKGQFAKGKALMQDLSDPGKNVLSAKVPNSGTADRLMLNLATTGGLGMVSPEALAGAGLGSLLYTPAGQKAIAALLARRPDLLRGAGNRLQLGAGRLGGLGAIAAPAATEN